MKDAFVVPGPLDEIVATVRAARASDPDLVDGPLSPADAKVRITEAVERGAMTIPPTETETWPACRPLVEWMTSLLPDGGTGYERPEWPDEAVDDLARRFRASPFAAGVDDPDDLLSSLLWFGTDYGPGDPMRWSPAAVEILLLDWIPRKIVADVEHLTRAPELLRAFIRFCHHERGIRPGLTEETVAAVDEFEPEYQELIRSDRLQGPEALLAAMGVYDRGSEDDEPTTTWRPRRPWSPRSCSRRCSEAVGGEGTSTSWTPSRCRRSRSPGTRCRPTCTRGSARCSISWSAAVRSCSTTSTGRPAAACSRTSRRATRRSSGAGERRR